VPCQMVLYACSGWRGLYVVVEWSGEKAHAEEGCQCTLVYDML